mgnify:CR=1 FL=1
MKYPLNMEKLMYLHFNRYEESERIQKLGMVIPFSNTERMNFACPRLWTYKHIQNYTVSEKAEALSYGTIWHTILEHILLKAKDQDKIDSENAITEYVEEIIDSVIENYFMENGNEDSLNENHQFGFIQEIRDRITLAIPGWYRSWVDLLERFKVLEVELVVCAPILDYNGEIAKFPTYIMENDKYARPSRIGELEGSKLVDIPYYKIGKIDVLLQERSTLDLWICDHKTSGSPANYENSITFDVQLPSYASLLDYEINYGALQNLKGCEIRGVIYDISHSKIKGIPDLLKSGKLSKAKNAGLTSWIFEKAIAHYELGRSQYADHIEFLKNNADPKKNFQRYFYLNMEDIDRCTDEDYGIAYNMSNKRKSLVEITADSVVDFNAISYRYPICQKYGNCTFSSFCLANTLPAVIELEIEDQIKWSSELPTLTSDDDLPF